ncbi:NAD-dependent epimerase/dehydratase family protein [Herbidospora cretacea]|uniref:NAD-dependent epimerase/dehydratase family protein n=1 Tax=Herbidospora cretacea TaxID=28444 RepID=UPI000555C11A|nr:NAD(P)-dependent oxidoreductase [Herbidospora cretacea]
MVDTPRRVLVTGAAGRLGRATLALLAELGVEATGLDREPSDAGRAVVGDAGDPATVRRALAGVDAVLHFAAIPAPTLGTPAEVYCGNTRATFVVLEEAGRLGVSRVALASSLSVTGMPWAAKPLHPAYLPIDERLPLQNEDPYGLSKEADEATGAMMARRFGMAVVALRYPLLGGPGDKFDDTAARYADDPGSGAAELWTYLDDRDAARAAWLALTAPLTGYHAVFVTAPTTLAPQPTEELLDRFHPGVERRRAFPNNAAPVDLTAAETLLGFRAAHLFPAKGR